MRGESELTLGANYKPRISHRLGYKLRPATRGVRFVRSDQDKYTWGTGQKRCPACARCANAPNARRVAPAVRTRRTSSETQATKQAPGDLRITLSSVHAHRSAESGLIPLDGVVSVTSKGGAGVRDCISPSGLFGKACDGV